MADSLRRLVNIASFSILQEKLERWLDVYHGSTCDQNVTRCLEIIELNARVQAQLFKLLSLTAAEGGVYGGTSVLKSRLLPWLGHGGVTGSAEPATLSALAAGVSRDGELHELQDMYERSLHGLQIDLTTTQSQAEQLKVELELKRDELVSIKRQSASEKMFTESEIQELRNKLRSLEDELIILRSRGSMVDNYERQIRRLKDDVNTLSSRKDTYFNGDADVTEAVKTLTFRSTSPFSYTDPTQRVRQQKLVVRFNDMFAQDRLDAMDTLRKYSDDHENNQRVVFAAIQESFAAARLSFANFKMKVRSTLAVTHVGPETLDEAVQDYINRNSDLYDLPVLVAEVVRALNHNSRLFLPEDVSYIVIQPFIREAIKLAWHMCALPRPLDLAPATTLELYDDSKYRRSYDSDYTAPLVNHHIWPCLQQGLRVIMKGEACTLRNSTTPRRARSPSRSMTPNRSASPNKSRSRSVSPARRGETDGMTSASRASSHAVSTSLSHYGVQS